jgi:hypothetical protein
VTRVYDEAGNLIETREHKREFKAWGLFTRITSEFPLKQVSMTPLLSGSATICRLKRGWKSPRVLIPFQTDLPDCKNEGSDYRVLDVRQQLRVVVDQSNTVFRVCHTIHLTNR